MTCIFACHFGSRHSPFFVEFPSVAGTPTLGLALGCPYIGAELRANRLGAQNNMMFPFTTAERATCFIGKEATEDGERRAAVLAGTSMSWLLD